MNNINEVLARQRRTNSSDYLVKKGTSLKEIDEKLAWFQPFIAEAMGYPERATHFARHYDDWDYFDA